MNITVSRSVPTIQAHRFFSTAGMSGRLKSIVEKQFPIHPFQGSITQENRLPLLRNYLAMSQAFPYLQAGSQKELVFAAIQQNADIPKDVEQTSVVGNFLCWDETGGHQLILENGMPALPKILDTRRHFHSNLLKKDLTLLLKQNIQPDYSPVTQVYLKTLYNRLSSHNKLVRGSMMVGFEMHAYPMIVALWQSVSDQFQVDKEKLDYFKTHVGGENPAEAHHVAMTQSLIRDLVLDKEEEQFIQEFQKSYALNINWCRSLVLMKEKTEGIYKTFVWGLGFV